MFSTRPDRNTYDKSYRPAHSYLAGSPYGDSVNMHRPGHSFAARAALAIPSVSGIRRLQPKRSLTTGQKVGAGAAGAVLAGALTVGLMKLLEKKKSDNGDAAREDRRRERRKRKEAFKKGGVVKRRNKKKAVKKAVRKAVHKAAGKH